MLTILMKLIIFLLGEDEFVVDLALSELTRLKVDLNNFIIKNKIEDDNEKTVKKLLQEKKNGEE